MHEKEHDQARLYQCDRKRYDHIEWPEILKGHERRQGCQREKGTEYAEIGFSRNYVL